MKFKYGYVQSNETGERADVIVDSKHSPIKLVDIGIGAGAIVTGVVYLMRKAFVSGGKSHQAGEIEAMNKLGILEDITE